MDHSTKPNLSLKERKEDDDVSVIAVIGKEKDRPSMHRQSEKWAPSKDRLQNDRRVIELGNEPKMMLRKRSESEALSTETGESPTDYKRIEILQKLPPGMIMFKQERKYKDDSDYVKDSTETSSGGSTSGAPAKVRRIHRTTRRTRGTREIRRNPIRVTKKDLDKGYPRQRQQLISTKKKETFFDLGSTKQGKSSTMPYMNTRSVTRKMYNVGATYQAPTARDEMEWKEWPVHGMHERPVFHPQVGLAAEYLGRYYTSFDGLSYHEIVDRPEIEVVSVDPHCDSLPSSGEKRRKRRSKMTHSSSNLGNSRTSVSSKRLKSFESCMHESFHCVLGYCSQVMTPNYKTNVEGKINKLSENKSPNIMKESEKQSSTRNIVESTSKYKSTPGNKEKLQKMIDGNKISNNYSAIMMSQNAKNFNQMAKTRLFPAQKVYVANSQKSAIFSNHRTLQSGQIKVQDMMRSSNHPLVLVNTLEGKDTQFLRPLPSNMNLIQLEDNESLFDIPSVLNNAIPTDDLSENSKMVLKQVPMKRGNKPEFTVTKYLLDNSQQNRALTPKETNAGENKLSYETTTKEVNTKKVSEGNKTWCASDTSEIAKILSEYNKSSTKKPAIENQEFYTNLKNIRMKDVSNKEENVKQNVQEGSMMRNMNIKFPEGKWRRFHLTVEKLKDMKNSSNERKTLSGVSNRQSLFKIAPTVDPALDKHNDNLKYLELSQKSSTTNLEKKENKNNSMNIMTNATTIKTQSLQELLENTAMLYCAATGTHQDDLANYIDSLDATQSIKWLETFKNLTV